MKQKTKLKLFVWTEFCPDYSGGLAFAIAKDEADARQQVEATMRIEVYDWGNLTTYPIRPFAASVMGGG